MYTRGSRHDAEVRSRHELRPGDRLSGPAIVTEDHATTVIEPGWDGEVTASSDLVLSRRPSAAATPRGRTDADPVLLEVFNNAFMSIAEQMGSVLEKTAHSVNIKERLDFSCALFDERGGLVANAPHMPVHLGSMGESVRSVAALHRGAMRPGDVFVQNDPYGGGTHLPDVTAVMPVFHGATEDPLFFVAARGHHADIGGITPGSMPPDSTSLEEEGVLLDGCLLVRDGRFLERELRERLGSGRWPARNPAQNVADLKAQVAACEKGRRELDHLVDEHGLDTVTAFVAHVQKNAEEQVRRVIASLGEGSFRYALDDGSAVEVTVSFDRTRRSGVIDFAGTSELHPRNFNAPRAVCRAAVLYVFRTLVDEEIPMNEGCLAPLEIRIPEGSLLDPRPPAGVVAGNVETSQCIVDALYGALRVLAGSQGTMNNFTFGSDGFQYYETVCGGSGAGATFDGADAVHTHMTNSRLTDPEVLEWRYPVRVEEFSIRRGSGGRGHRRGGDGAIRRLRFLEPMKGAILANRRVVPPFGLDGGEAGAPGLNWIERNGEKVELAGAARFELRAGDVFVVLTPGGGGFGAPIPGDERGPRPEPGNEASPSGTGTGAADS